MRESPLLALYATSKITVAFFIDSSRLAGRHLWTAVAMFGSVLAEYTRSTPEDLILLCFVKNFASLRLQVWSEAEADMSRRLQWPVDPRSDHELQAQRPVGHD